jgi:hypothetical protein
MIKNQNGNVLLIIFAAVALFAALSYAVTQTTRGGTDLSKEKLKLTASYLIEWHMNAKHHYNKLRFIRGYPIDGLSMTPPGHGWTQPCDRNADPKCSMYDHREYGDPDGIGMGYIKLPLDDYLTNDYGGAYLYANPNFNGEPYLIRVEGLGDSDKGELVIVTQVVRHDICKEFNKQLGLSNTFPLDTWNDERYEFSAGSAIPEPATGANSNIGDEVAELAGKELFCVRHAAFSGNNTKIINVLEAR